MDEDDYKTEMVVTEDFNNMLDLKLKLQDF